MIVGKRTLEIGPEIDSVLFHRYAHIQAAIACLVSDNRWLDTIKLISVIKEVPLPKLVTRELRWQEIESSASFSALHSGSVIISSRYLATR